MDYRFLQVFFPTRGILAYYSRASGEIKALPGADDPQYVHCDAVWTPDGEQLVFARARAKDPNPADGKLAERANDPAETQIQYDLYQIPFRGGHGGPPQPIAGASGNGMSNTFPKVSPDGRWIVFVQCRNGQLMRPDSTLWIVPAAGGTARRMRCNTDRMAVCPQADVRDGGKAVELAKRACAVTGYKNPVLLNTLAAAYAEQGDFSAAVTLATNALRLVAPQDTVLAQSIRENREGYRAGKPCRPLRETSAN